MTHPERIPEYLQHIIVASNRVRLYSEAKSKADFDSDVLLQDALFRAVEVIGEAAARIRAADRDFIARHELLAFTEAIGLRNRLAHEYDDVDLKVTWETVVVHVPALREKVIQLLHTLAHPVDLDSLHF